MPAIYAKPCQSVTRQIDNLKTNMTLFKKYQGKKEDNVLFNDALNTFYLRLYASDIW